MKNKYYFMTKISEVLDFMELWAPTNYQEDYDNAGLIVGNKHQNITKILVSLDATEAVVDEAIQCGANLIIAHHPVVFRGLKKINGNNYVERTIIDAIKNDIAIYASHTNLDHVHTGVNAKIAEKLELQNTKILSPKTKQLIKLTVFEQIENAENLMKALHIAGAGNIGNYSECAYLSNGVGQFMANDLANPTIGKANILEKVNETKIEVIFPIHLKQKILLAMKANHSYQEVAYYLTILENENQEIGAGMIGELKFEMTQTDFLKHVKDKMKAEVIKYTPIAKSIRKVAICGGAGSFLLPIAKAQGADAFVTADYKYHEFFDAENQILIADIGHFESEQHTKELIHFQLSKKFTNFATLLSETKTNPVKYYF